MRFFLVTALLLGPALASADDNVSRTPDVSQMKTDDCARARKAGKLCVINMGEGESIEASTPTAGGAAIGIVQFGKAASLIRIRKDFIAEILRSAEDID
jgi:hypothetical protein